MQQQQIARMVCGGLRCVPPPQRAKSKEVLLGEQLDMLVALAESTCASLATQHAAAAAAERVDLELVLFMLIAKVNAPQIYHCPYLLT